MGWRINKNASCALSHCAAFIFGMGFLATNAIAATPVPDANRKAYDLTIRCFVAGAVANSDKRFNLGGANKAALDAGGKRAFDAVYIMGGKLGLSKQHISDDFDAYGRVYQRAFLKDDASFLRTRSDCIKLGLM
jgi:hypothetical protein